MDSKNVYSPQLSPGPFRAATFPTVDSSLASSSVVSAAEPLRGKNTPGARAVVGAACLLSLLCFSGCVSHRWEARETLHDDSRLIVQVEEHVSLDGEATVSYAHPGVVSREQVERCLHAVRARSRRLIRKHDTVPAVEASHVPALAEAVAGGLAGASGTQRIRFRVFNLEPGIVFQRETLTTGVAFVEPAGTFNLVFGRLAESQDPDEVDEQETWVDPTRPGHRFHRGLVLAGDAQLYIDASGDAPGNWVVYPLSERAPPMSKPDAE